MVAGKLPACAATSFAGSDDTSERINKHEKNNTLQNKQSQLNIEKNLILLNLSAYKLPENHKIPATIASLINELGHSFFKTKKTDEFNRHSAEKKRLIRSTIRQAGAIIRAVLTHYYNVETGEVGYFTDKGHLKRLSYKMIAKKAGLKLITVKRFFRFLKLRKHVTLVYDRKKNPITGKWYSNIAKKIITPSFFIEVLGVKAWKKIEALRQWMLKKAKKFQKRKERTEQTTQEQKKNIGILKQLIGGITNCRRSKTGATPAQRSNYTEDCANREKAMIQKAKAMQDRDPRRSYTEYLKEIKQSTA